MYNTMHSSEGATGSEQPSPKAHYFISEIQSMMHGFGDARAPLVESAIIVESVVQQQLRIIMVQAAEVSEMRGAKCICPEDILFLLRKDRVKMHRLLRYLALKDLRNNFSNILIDTAVDGDMLLDIPGGPMKKRSRMCLDFVQSFDPTGEMTDTSSLPVDMIKYERNVRAERSSRMLDETRYMEFVNARRASFASVKSASKFREWLKSRSDDIPRLAILSYDLLGYLAYEAVAQIVDLALLVRQDSMARPDTPFSRYLPGVGYSTCQNLDTKQIEAAPPLTPAEIREALRRFWNSPLGPTAMLNTQHCTPELHSSAELLDEPHFSCASGHDGPCLPVAVDRTATV